VRAGSGSRPLRLRKPQASAVVELSAPDHAPIVRGLTDCEATPAADIETIITAHTSDSIVANTRPRYSSETFLSSCYIFSTELTPTAARESAIKNRARG
jgi:hypothetical protein